MTAYECVIGLEVHAELATQSKMFCGCPVVDSTEAPPNTAVCPVCAAMPGTLPVINRRAVEYAMRVGLALNCHVAEVNRFARKNYFYPDLPKGYQISQYALPLNVSGNLDIDLADGETKRVRIRRAHLEEDTGKLTHVADDGGGYSLVDLNRAGVPLLEIVSEPDMRSAAEAEAYARKLRSILQYLGVNSGDMSKGVLRFEANVSVRPAGSDELRTRTEVKNLNSIRSMTRAIEYEFARQVKIYEAGGEVAQETLGWDDVRGVTLTQRSKEQAHDYRYFPEPDLPPLEIARDWVEDVRESLPELPDAKRARYIESYGLSAYDAGVLTAERAVGIYFEAAVAAGGDPGEIANWITGPLFGAMNREAIPRDQIGTVKAGPEALAALAKLVASDKVNRSAAGKVFDAMFARGGSPEALVEEMGLAQLSDEGAIAAVVRDVIAANPDEVADYVGGKESLVQWFMGQVMRATRGKANPQIVLPLIREELEAKRNE